MASQKAGRSRPRSAAKQGSIPSKLTLAVLPVSVVAVLAGLFLVWSLISSDTSTGFSTIDIMAIVIAVVVTVVALGSLLAMYVIGKSMSHRIGEVSYAARRVANKDLVDLLEALRGPDPDLDAIAPLNLDTDMDDELGRLARSLEDLHAALIEVAARQMETLREGVSSIFATLARRNTSLVDRQIALLDELESREESPEVLGGFYQVDHLATRMRRNAESLLVLAGSESPRVWARATDMSDVVRAAVGEVDEYQRIEVLALEPARLVGGAVTDLVHLFAELLENAVQFSPPVEPVRVTGLFNVDGYQLSVSDGGVGMTDARVGELNRILAKPPALGLSVEPTLGAYVVAKLAHRHGLTVELIQGNPGITAKVTVPRDRLVPMRSSEAVPEESEGDDEAGMGRHTPKRQYVLKRSREAVSREVDLPVMQPAAEANTSAEVIDLTRPSMIEPDRLVREASRSGASVVTPPVLPVRTPGQAFRDEQSQGIVVGEGPTRIKSALTAYDRGRRAAVDDGQEVDDSSEDRE